jgi:hypothetical protein
MRRILTALVVVALLGACGSADSGDSAATTESSAPKPVFDFATDSLCDWFTVDDMNEILAVTQQRAGTAYDFKAFNSCDTMWRAEEPSSPGDTVLFMLEPAGVERRPVPPQPGRVDPPPEQMIDPPDPDDFVPWGPGSSLMATSYAWEFEGKPGVQGFLLVPGDGHQDEPLYYGVAFDITEGTETLDTTDKLGIEMVHEVLERMNWITQ